MQKSDSLTMAQMLDLWEAHTKHEFENKDVNATMATMGASPHLLNVPTNEHIYWDQASVLVQIGLLNRVNLPVSGIESARKIINLK
jgi:hypothetical protein